MTRQERPKPIGKGEVKGNARRTCPCSQSGKNRRGKSRNRSGFWSSPKGAKSEAGVQRGAAPLLAHFFGLFDRFRDAEHNVNMIHSFTCLDTEALFRSQVVPRFKNIERVARRKLLQIHAATELASLRVPPGNQLEALKGDRRGQHSIRINDQWRICFVWHDDGAHQVEIVDYH